MPSTGPQRRQLHRREKNMRRVMIIGQPRSGKSTLARLLGKSTGLPVFHIDQIHWKPGWEEREADEKSRLCHEVHQKHEWIFEGGHSKTWPDRVRRCDTLIWLDFRLSVRVRRVVWRTLREYGQTRSDLPPNCPERFSLEFYQWIWSTRNTAKRKMAKTFASAQRDKQCFRLSNSAEVREFVKRIDAKA